MSIKLQATWNGEKIQTGQPHPGYHIAALDGYDPTPWDYETPAAGSHAIHGAGESPQIAICDLIEQLLF